MNRVTRHLLFLAFTLTSLASQAGNIFPVDTVHQYTLDCGTMELCLPLPAANLSNYSVFLDGNPYSASIAGCDFDTTVTYSYATLFGVGNLGPYHLDSWSMNGSDYEGTFDNIDDLVDMLNDWDPEGQWEHETSTLSIKGGTPGYIYSDMEVTVMSNGTPSTIGLNFGLLPQGTEMQFEPGEHTLIVFDNLNNEKDTLTVLLECLIPPPPTTFADTVQADGLPYTMCLDTADLVGNFTSIFNACPNQSGTFVSFYVDEANLCVKYSGQLCGGTETACITVCDDLGLCDTTYFEITVDVGNCSRLSQKINDSLLINFTDVHCVDTSNLPGEIISVENLCPGESGESVVFEYDEDTHCVTYTGIEVGLDQGCFLLTDQFGNMDTVYVCVDVRLPENGTIIDTLLIGLDETYCIDTSELAGNILNIENFCPALSGDEVEFALDGVNLCVEAQSLFVGTDTACIVICDDFGICDTTYLYITVVPDSGDPCATAPPPDAVNDEASTLLNTPVDIDILANDDLGNCFIPELNVLDMDEGGIGPGNGIVVTNPDMTVTYMPNVDFCGTDYFMYSLCNEMGCDTATVVVTTACVETPDEIIIYNGFSPNDDGVNEVFKIENIEMHPNNEVFVFNRWGTQVFAARGYTNYWDGKYRGTSLPDGTYFYLIYLDGRRQEFSGHLQINR
jgi:gliding motility-associated-like protein